MIKGQMNLAESTIGLLFSHGIDTVFTVPGLQINIILQRIIASGKLRLITCNHESGAVFMADGYIRSSGKKTIVFFNGGAGLLNSIGAISTSCLERVPVIVISGDAPVKLHGYQAFNETTELGTNDAEVTRPITKLTSRVANPELWLDTISSAIKTAWTYPYGPVHLIVPYDLWNKHGSFYPANENEQDYLNSDTEGYNLNELDEVTKEVQSEKLCLCVIGENYNSINYVKLLEEFACEYQVPIVTTYGGKMCISDSSPFSLGNCGYAGKKNANELLLSESIQTVLFLGVHLNERNTCAWDSRIFNNRNVYCIDKNIPPNKIFAMKNIRCIDFHPELFLKEILDRKIVTQPKIKEYRKKWIEEFKKTDGDFPIPEIKGNDLTLEPSVIISHLRKILTANTALFVDSGQHKIFPGMYWKTYSSNEFFVSNIGASTGWAIASAIGAKICSPGKTVAIWTGDGCMRMLALEIQTLVRQNLQALFFVCNNKSWGAINSRQPKDGCDYEYFFGNFNNNWETFAKSINAEGFSIRSIDELDRAVNLALNITDKPSIFDISVTADPFIPETEITRPRYE